MSTAKRDRSGLIGKLVIRLIRFYQRRISPFKPPRCKYYPTCSQYAIEAIRFRGMIIGSLLAIWRLLRCNPFSRGGYDPVPGSQDETY